MKGNKNTVYVTKKLNKDICEAISSSKGFHYESNRQLGLFKTGISHQRKNSLNMARRQD